MKTYKFHPAANIFPLDNQGPEFEAFAEDIRRTGLQHSIILHEGKILDGRRRYVACQQMKIEPRFLAWDGKGSPKDFVISANLHRRHLTPSQRAAIGLEFVLDEEAAAAKERQRLSKGRGKKGAKECATLTGKATERAAQRVGCSTRLIEQTKRIHAQSPKLVLEIARGTLTVANAQANLKSESGVALSKTQTPPSVCYWIWQTLVETGYVPSVILDPAAGSGNLSAPFRQANSKLRVIEFETDRGRDFLTRTKTIKCDLVICNPPFDKACDFLKRICKLVDTTTPMVFIAPVSSVIGFQEKEWHALLRSPNCPTLTSITPLPPATFVGARTPAVILWFNLPAVQAPIISSDYLVRSNGEFVLPTIDLPLSPKVKKTALKSTIRPTIKLICGDALEQLRKLPSASVESCVTSPPFFLLRDYQCNGQYGLEATIDKYIETLVTAFREVRRVLKPSGNLWVNIADSFVANAAFSDRKKYSTPKLIDARRRAFKKTHLGRKSLFFAPFRLATALADDGWIGRCDIVVQKTNLAPEAVVDRPVRTHEYVFLFAKTERNYFDADVLREEYAPKTAARGFNQFGDYTTRRSLNPKGKNGGSVWRINIGTRATKDHPAPMPLELAVKCVLAGCPVGGTVLDPFVGSGTTAVACVENQRHCIGIDLNAEYLDIARRRVVARNVAA